MNKFPLANASIAGDLTEVQIQQALNQTQAIAESASRTIGKYPRWVVWIAAFLLVCLLSACGSTGRVVNHSFGFDIRRAVPAVEVLDYRYGTFNSPGTRPAQYQLDAGHGFYFEAITGPIPVAEFLYVKWRIKETGEVFEDTVDLRQRLPRDMKDKRVYFDIKGQQLYVYLISREYLPKDAPRSDLRVYFDHPYITLYPDSLSSQQ